MEPNTNYNKDYEVIYNIYKDDIIGFRIWLQKALMYNKTEPLIFNEERDTITSFLVDIYRRSKNLDLQEKLFKESLLILLEDYSKHQGDTNYLFNLILLIGKIRISAAQKIISNLFFDTSMRNTIHKNNELFSLTFGVLAGFRNISEKTYQLFCDYIENPDVKNICFRGIIKTHPSEAHHYIKMIINREEDEGIARLNFLFNSIIKDISLPNFLRILPQFIHELNEKELKYFLSLEFYQKYSLEIDYDLGLITYLDPIGKKKKIEVSFNQEKLESNNTFIFLMLLYYEKMKSLKYDVKRNGSFKASIIGG